MRRWILLSLFLLPTTVWAFRAAKPPTFTEWKPNAFTQLNQVLEDMWNTLNGRDTRDITTTNPNGSRTGFPGEVVIFNNLLGNTYKICVNVSANTGGTTWRCSANTLTAP